jgi:hypothetical protein
MSQRRSIPSLRLLFGAVIFLSSFLLFLVEPIAARQLLPVFGGSAAVWITCLVLFQTALLFAYLYAHWLALRSKWLVHMVLLLAAAASALVWTSHTFVPGTEHPVLSIFIALSLSIGLPFLALGATSPLLQVWVARIETGRIPYRLYALSNLASLLALLAYPTDHRAVFNDQKPATDLVLRLYRLCAPLGFCYAEDPQRNAESSERSRNRRISSSRRILARQAYVGSVAHGRGHAAKCGHQLPHG